MKDCSELQPPSESAAEIALLGWCMWDNAAISQAAAILSPEDFWLDAHRRIFRSMTALVTSGNPVDIVTLGLECKRNREVDAVGGMAYLASLTEGLPKVGMVARYAAIVKAAAQLRRLMVFGNQLVFSAATAGTDPAELMAAGESRLLEMRAEVAPIAENRVASSIVPLLDRMNRERERTSELLGMPTGIHAFDMVTRGLQEGQIIMAAAWTGNGKSSFGIQAASTNAGRGTPVLIFSVEMTREDVLRRVLSSVSNVPFIRVRDPRWATEQDWAAVQHAAEKVADWPLFIDADSSLHIDQLVARARLAIRRDGVRLVVVDYVQIIRSSEKEERLRVAAISRGLTRLAKEESVPVIALSQLARPDRSNAGRAPRMSDLRESSQLECDAHVVALLHRPLGEDGHPGDEAELIIAKQRSGAVGTFPLTFNMATLTFQDRKDLAGRHAVAS